MLVFLESLAGAFVGTFAAVIFLFSNWEEDWNEEDEMYDECF